MPGWPPTAHGKSPNAWNTPYAAPGLSGFRLSIGPTTPYPHETSGAPTIYLVPFSGDYLTLPVDGVWKTLDTNGDYLSLPVVASSGTVQDVFVYACGRKLFLEQVAWSSTTARSVNVSRKRGAWVKTVDPTRLLIGTYYASGANVVTDSSATRGLWNVYNRLPRKLLALQTTDSASQTTGAYRESCATSTAGVSRVDAVFGTPEDLVVLSGLNHASHSGTAFGYTGIGLDSSTAVDTANCIYGKELITSTGMVQVHTSYAAYSAIGYHSFRLIESTSANTATWYGDNGGEIKSGLAGFAMG